MASRAGPPHQRGRHRHRRQRHHRPQARRPRPVGSPRRRRRRQPRKVRLPGQYEPRDPDAPERRGRPGPGPRPHRADARPDRDAQPDPVVRPNAPDPAQRHSGPGARRIRPPGDRPPALFSVARGHGGGPALCRFGGRQGPAVLRRHRTRSRCLGHGRRGPRQTDHHQSGLQRRQVHHPGLRQPACGAQRVGGRFARPSLHRRGYGRGLRGQCARQAFQPLRAGRRHHHAALRRHRPGSRNLPAAG